QPRAPLPCHAGSETRTEGKLLSVWQRLEPDHQVATEQTRVRRTHSTRASRTLPVDSDAGRARPGFLPGPSDCAALEVRTRMSRSLLTARSGALRVNAGDAGSAPTKTDEKNRRRSWIEIDASH